MDAYTVTELNTYIDSTLRAEGMLKNCFVKGTVTNFVRHRSGHFYFSLKDEHSSIDCALFANVASKQECIRAIVNGIMAIVRGSVSFYGPSGRLNFIISAISLENKSPLQIEFERLKNELQALGYFDEEHKQPLPIMSKCVGIVTSASGAVLHDILNVSRKRNPLVEFKLFSVPVQGKGVGAVLARGIEDADADPEVELIIIGRGGGSMEDLWCFNEKVLVEAIYHCSKPVISAVGHETDVTFCDFVADARASTPSHAAEMAVIELSFLLDRIITKKEYLDSRLLQHIQNEKFNVMNLLNKKLLYPSLDLLHRQRNKLRSFTNKLHDYNFTKLKDEQSKLALIGQSLELLNPLQLMLKGYTKVEMNGEVVKSTKDLSVNDEIKIVFADGSIKANIKEVDHG